MSQGRFKITRAIYVECFNEPALSEARWVLKMMDSTPFLAGLVAQICVQKGAEEVCLSRKLLDDLESSLMCALRNRFLTEIREPSGHLPKGLKGARRWGTPLNSERRVRLCLHGLGEPS